MALVCWLLIAAVLTLTLICHLQSLTPHSGRRSGQHRMSYFCTTLRACAIVLFRFGISPRANSGGRKTKPDDVARLKRQGNLTKLGNKIFDSWLGYHIRALELLGSKSKL